MKQTSKWTIAAVSALVLMVGASTSLAVIYNDSTVFGSDNDGLGAFTHTAIDGTNTSLTELAGSVQYRNQNVGSTDAAFIKQLSIDRTPDTGVHYTMSGTVFVSDGYADDNNRLNLVLFTDPTTALSRNNTGQIEIVWNTDDSSSAGSPGNNAKDNLSIFNGLNNLNADPSVLSKLRNQTTPYAQDLLQGTEITLSAEFWFTGTNINIKAFMTDVGGLTGLGTAVVAADDFTGDYFGFASTYRARNYDGDPDPTGAARDNPLVMDYKSFTVIPEPSTLGLVAFVGGGLVFIRRRHNSVR